MPGTNYLFSYTIFGNIRINFCFRDRTYLVKSNTLIKQGSVGRFTKYKAFRGGHVDMYIPKGPETNETFNSIMDKFKKVK